MGKTHEYKAHLTWIGNRGNGTATYPGYGREYRVAIRGKADLVGSANPMFRGDPLKHDPEDLFLTAISSCHMLSYLALCARRGITVTAYEDNASGTLALDGDGGRFTEVTLRPQVTIAGGDAALAEQLHHIAHEQCFIANSCSVPIRYEATVVRNR